MKRNSSIAKIFLAAVFFQSNLAVAQTYTQQTNSDVNSAAELQPLVCKKVPSPYWNSEQGGERPMVDDPACVAENNRRAQVRGQAAAVQAQTARSSSGDGTTLVTPKAPTYNCGSMDVHSEAFKACENSYNAANKQYQKDLAVYNEANNAKGESQSAAELAAMENQKNQTAAATLAEIKDKNDTGKKKFDATAAITMALGVAALVKGTACAATCSSPGGCCPAAPAYFATAAAMFLLNSKAKKQSGQHAASSAQACTAMNQISSTQTNCNPTSSGPGSTSTVAYDPVTGQCYPAGSQECKDAPTMGVAPPSVRDAIKASGFASGKNPNDLYSIQPDGSVKFKNGKTYKDGDFKDASSLMATGLSAAGAKSVMDAMNSSQGALAGLGDSKSAKKDLKDGFGGALGTSDGGTTVVDSSKAQNSDKKFSDDLGAKDKDKKFSDERAPSSEGLAKEFNGELIGVAGDDIFLMMNRRYKLKSEQDSFIAQDAK